MPTELCPASLSAAASALFGAPEEVPAENVIVPGETDAVVPEGKENFLAALLALLERNLGSGRTPAGVPFPPAHGARGRFAAEDMPKGLMKPVAQGLETGVSSPAEGAGEEETTGAPLDGLGCAGNGIPQLLWSAMLLGGVGAETGKEEPGNGRWGIPQILAALRAGTGKEGAGEAAPSSAVAHVPEEAALPTDLKAQGVSLEGFAALATTEHEKASAELIGRGVSEGKPVDSTRGLGEDSVAPQGAPGEDEAREREIKAPTLPNRTAGEAASKEGGPTFSPDSDGIPLPEGMESRDATAKGNATFPASRPCSLEGGDGLRPTVGTAEQRAQPGLVTAHSTEQEGKPVQAATFGDMAFPEAPSLKVQELPNNADAGGERGSGQEPAKGELGFAVPRSAAAETPGNALELKQGTEAFSRALHPEAMDRLVERAVLGVRAGQREIHIDLKPEFLGQVRLHISTDHQQVMVKMVAENTVTKELIESNVHQLRAALQNQGLEIRGFDISLAHDFGQQGAGYEPRSFSEGAATGEGEEASAHLSEEESRTSRIGTGQLGDTIDFFA